MTPQEKLAALLEAIEDNRGLNIIRERAAQVRAIAAALSEHGEVVITTDASGRCVSVTRQDGEGRILSVIWGASEHGGGGEAVAIPRAEKWLSDRDMEATQEWCDGWNTCAQYFGGKYTTPPTPSAPAPAAEQARPEARGVEAPADDCTATEWLDFANGNSVQDIAAALATPNPVRAEQPCTCPQHPDDVIPCPRHRAEQPEGKGAGTTLREALQYVGQRTDGGLCTLAERCELWMRESKDLLASAPAAPVVVDEAMVERAIDAADRVFAKHFGSLPGADDVDTEMMRAALTAALSEVTVDETTPRCGGEQYELDAYIWKRESTQEWVLELSGTIGDAHFISRHCEPLTTPPEDVAGLPSMYAAIQGESRD